MANFPVTVRAVDANNGFADRTFQINVKNDRIDRFIITGSYGHALSEDGVNWRHVIGASASGVLVEWCGASWYKLRYPNPTTPIFDVSVDGTDWKAIPLPTGFPTDFQFLIDMVHDSVSGRTYILGGRNDGVDYRLYVGYTTNFTSFTTLYNAIVPALDTYSWAMSLVCNGSTLMAALGVGGNDVNILLSTNSGGSWTFDPIVGSATLAMELKYYNKYYWLGTYGGGMWKSLNGVNWTNDATVATSTIVQPAGNVNGSNYGIVVTGSGLNPYYGNPRNFPTETLYGSLSPLTFMSTITGVNFAPIAWRTAIYMDTIVFAKLGANYSSPLFSVAGNLGNIIVPNDATTGPSAEANARPTLASFVQGSFHVGPASPFDYQGMTDLAVRNS